MSFILSRNLSSQSLFTSFLFQCGVILRYLKAQCDVLEILFLSSLCLPLFLSHFSIFLLSFVCNFACLHRDAGHSMNRCTFSKKEFNFAADKSSVLRDKCMCGLIPNGGLSSIQPLDAKLLCLRMM